jgi:hypothetical protein
MIMNLQGTVNAAADSLSTTNMYGRWYTVKYGEGDSGTSSCTQSLQLTLTCLSSFMQKLLMVQLQTQQS